MVGVSNYQGASMMFLPNLVLKSSYDVSVVIFCASPQLYAVGPHRLQYLFVHELIVYDRAYLLPMSQHISFLYFSPNSSRLFLT